MYLTDPKAKVRVGGGESAPWLLRHHKIDLFISLSLSNDNVFCLPSLHFCVRSSRQQTITRNFKSSRTCQQPISDLSLY